MSKIDPLSSNDPNSFSNPEDASVENLKIRWNIDFVRKLISGSVTYNIIVHKKGTRRIIMDIRNIKIKGVYDVGEGWSLDYTLDHPVSIFGQALSIKIPKLNANHKASIMIEYECEEQCPAIQWLTPDQTLMKKQPFLFSQCQAIYARSLLPCQDTPSTKFTFVAEVTAMKEVQVLMSGVRSGDPELVSGALRRHTFEQSNPIPSFLIAIVAGKLANKAIGPRTKVWAERDLLEKAASDFSDIEKMLQVAESLFGQYTWGNTYDILILPPSFPFGGMENPCLTFTTPAILTGDKSLSFVICHEMAHSWFGNLVTNKTFEHFWLNEGLAIFAQRKIVGKLMGEPVRQFLCHEGWNELHECIRAMQANSPLTVLVPKLNGINPEESFTTEKGCTFLYYLEETVGGPESFDPFLRHYIEINRFKSVDTETFKAQFIEYFNGQNKASLIEDINWLGWLYTPGMPLVKPHYDTSLADMCSELKTRWLKWNPSKETSPFKKSDIENFNSLQIVEFLAELLDEAKDWDSKKVIAMEEAYGFNSNLNGEIRYRWIRLCLRSKWQDAVPEALKMVTDFGRLKYIRPIYRDLYEFEDVRQQAIDTFENNKPNMMYVTVLAVAKDLHVVLPPKEAELAKTA